MRPAGLPTPRFSGIMVDRVRTIAFVNQGICVAVAVSSVPVHGTYVLDATLITKENAANYCFPDSPF